MRTSAQDPLLYSASHSCQPWHGDSAPADARTIPSSDVYDQRMMEICLRCTYPECINCFDGWKMILRIRPPKSAQKKKTKRKRK